MGSVLSAEDQLLGPNLATRRRSGVRGLVPPHWVGLFMEKNRMPWLFLPSLAWGGIWGPGVGLTEGSVLLGGR